MKIEHLKYLKPYYRWEINTNLSIYEIRGLLGNNLKPFGDKNDKFVKVKKDFAGELKNNEFIIENNTWNSFGYAKPQIIGEFISGSDGAKMRAEFIFTYGKFIISLTGTFALIILHAIIVASAFPDADLPRDEIVFFSTLVFVLVFLSTYLNFWLETLNSIASFRIILKEHII